MKKIIIIPAYNEEENIEKTVNAIQKSAQGFDYVIINDCSIDNTRKICEEKGFNIVNLPINLGIGGAVQTGYKYAYENDYDVAVQFDGDGQHDVRYVKDIIKPIKENKADMVIGSRFIDKSSSNFKSSKARRIGITLISFFIKLITGKKIYDTTSGFRAANKKVIERFVDNYPVEYPEPVSTTEVLRLGYNVEEIPVSMNERENGVSSIKAWKNVYYMVNVILSIVILGLGVKKNEY